MSTYRTRNKTILAKIEATPGTDSTPVVGTDALLCEQPRLLSGLEVLETDEVTGSLDVRAPVVGGGNGQFTCSVNLKGAATAGQAPEWGVLLRGCSFAETLRAAALTGTCQAGSAANTIVLAAGAGTGVNVGEIVRLTGGTGSGQDNRVVVSKSTDTMTIYPNWTVTPDGTTTYSIDANALYVPASANLKNLTIYEYLHNNDSSVNSRLRKLLGAMGNVNLTFPNRGLAKAQFTFMGKFATPTDVAKPAAPTFETTRPIAFQAATCTLDGSVIKFQQCALDLGNQVVAADDPADTYGVDVAQIARRSTRGRINPHLTLLSTRNVFADFTAGADRKLLLSYGAVAGNRVACYLPAARYIGEEPEDVNSLMYEGIPFAAQGEDTGVYIHVR